VIADVGGNGADPSPEGGDTVEVEAAIDAASEAVPWRFETQLEALVDVAMLIAIPALFLMAMLALVIPL